LKDEILGEADLEYKEYEKLLQGIKDGK